MVRTLTFITALVYLLPYMNAQDTLRITSWSAGEFETVLANPGVGDSAYIESTFQPEQGGEAVVLVLDSSSSQRMVKPAVTEAKYYIYPNPGSGLFYINGRSGLIRKLEVFSPIGELLLESIIQDKPWAALDLMAFPPGIYYLLIMDSSGSLKPEKLVRR